MDKMESSARYALNSHYFTTIVRSMDCVTPLPLPDAVIRAVYVPAGVALCFKPPHPEIPSIETAKLSSIKSPNEERRRRVSQPSNPRKTPPGRKHARAGEGTLD